MPTDAKKPSMGILQFDDSNKLFRLERFAPQRQLAPFVKHYWLVSWDLRDSQPFLQDVIPNPCVNLVAEEQRCAIYGVASSKYTKRLSGQGRAFGVKFNPGGFYPYYGQPLTQLTDSAIALDVVLPSNGSELIEAVASDAPPARLIEIAEALLLSRLPAPDPAVSLTGEIVDYARTHREVAKVEQLCEPFSLSPRKLQRLFGQYVGVSPKWIITLYRLQNAAETIDQGFTGGWSELAQELGYYDQSHFINSFKSIIGQTPDEYARRGNRG